MKDLLWTSKGIQLWIKRDDLIHPVVSGNKYRKLSFLLPLLKEKCYKGLLSFGGPYSNHIHALAWICREYEIPLTVIIRSYENEPQSPTLADVRNWGAQIHPLTPEQYKSKDHPDQLGQWKNEFPGFLIIPEGGSHPHALDGVCEMMLEIEKVLPVPDIFMCPVGTGATLAGMVRFKKQQQEVIGVSALKSSTVHQELEKRWKLKSYSRWTVAEQWHFGGYGRITEELRHFIDRFNQNHGILLDPLYNGKAMYAFVQYVKFGLIPPGRRVVFIHTGGLQGWRGFKAESPKQISSKTKGPNK